MATAAPKTLAEQPLDRAIALLVAVARADRAVTVTELAQRCALPLPTAHRLVGQLEQRGLLKRAIGTRKVLVGAALVELGGAALQAALRTDRTHQVLDALAGEIGEHCQIGYRAGNEVVYADSVRAARSSGLHFEQGRRAPLHCSSTGKLFLADLPPADLDWWLANVTRAAHTPNTIVSARGLRGMLREVRASGWATSDEELAVGVVGCAVPIRATDGRLVAGLGISVPKARVDCDALAQFRPAMERAAVEIARRLDAD